MTGRTITTLAIVAVVLITAITTENSASEMYTEPDNSQ